MPVFVARVGADDRRPQSLLKASACAGKILPLGTPDEIAHAVSFFRVGGRRLRHRPVSRRRRRPRSWLTSSPRNGAGPVSSSPAPQIRLAARAPTSAVVDGMERLERPWQRGEGVVERLESALTRNLEEQELPGSGLPDLDARAVL